MGWTWPVGLLDHLGGFLVRQGILDGPVTASAIGDGHSNLTFLVDDGERQVIVRRPPPPPLPKGGHDVLREARVMRALHGTRVPVPEVLAVAPAGEVFDVPFYVMTHVPGVVVTTATPFPLDRSEIRRELGCAVIDALAALHEVDPAVVGLADFGRPENFNARHIDRLRALVASPGGEAPTAFRAVDAWLRAHAPIESDHRLVHLDFRLGNLLLDAAPPRVAAVLDWELSTLGDPLWDVGYLLASWPTPNEPATPVTELGTAVHEPGWPTRDELAARYAERSGRSLADLAWYVAAGQWKLAVLYEYGRRRAVAGHGDPYFTDPRLVPRFLDAAHRAAGLPVG